MKDLTPVTREEKILHAIATGEEVPFTPVTREEKFLVALSKGEAADIAPATRKEYFLNEIIESGTATSENAEPADESET